MATMSGPFTPTPIEAIGMSFQRNWEMSGQMLSTLRDLFTDEASPKQLMRKYRALRAATVLCDPEAPPGLRTKVESLFYDQPHMIREIRHFTGRTPGALDSDDTKILRVWLSKDNFRQLEAYPG